MFANTVKSVNVSETSYSAEKSSASVNKVAPGHTKGGSWWERLTGQR